MALSADDMKAITERATTALSRMSGHRRRLQRIYKFAMPFRKTGVRGDGPSDDKDLAEIYDSTAISSTFRSAGKLKNSMFPDHEPFFRREPAKLGKKFASFLKNQGFDEKKFREALNDDDGVINAIFMASDWPVSTHEFCLDLIAGHSCMFIPACDEHVARFVTVPADQVANECNTFGDNTGVFWPTRYKGRQLLEDFPEAPWPKKLKDELEAGKNRFFPVSIDAVLMASGPKKEWVLIWRHKDMDVPIREERSATCPWVIGRYYRVPGEERGRGMLDLALPTIETLNQTQEFILKAAALAVLGVFMATNEAALNPDTIQLAPGSIIPVQRTGGALGPSLARLDAPGRFDVSQMIINEMRIAVKEMLGDSTLPGDAAVRSATEVADRIRRLADDHVGATSRMHKEIVVAVVDRVSELAKRHNLLTLDAPMPQLLVMTVPIGPLAIASRAAKFKVFFDWLTAIAQFAPALLPVVARLEIAAIAFAREIGVPEEFIADDAQQKGQQTMIEQQVQERLKALLAQIAEEAKTKATAVKAAPQPSAPEPAPV